MTKRLNCLEMKDGIQARMLRDMAGLSPKLRADAIHAALDRSRTPIGRLWRELRDRETLAVSRVAEAGVKYGGKDEG